MRFLLDTNVLLHDANALNVFSEHNVILTVDVLEELDRFKRGNDELARNARRVVRAIEKGWRKEQKGSTAKYALKVVLDNIEMARELRAALGDDMILLHDAVEDTEITVADVDATAGALATALEVNAHHRSSIEEAIVGMLRPRQSLL